MILEILRVGRRLDKKLEDILGRPYRVVLSVGLVVAIIHQVRDLMNAPFTKTGFARMAIGILFGSLLLINQMGELSNRLEQRSTRRTGDRSAPVASGVPSRPGRSKRHSRRPVDPPDKSL